MCFIIIHQVFYKGLDCLFIYLIIYFLAQVTSFLLHLQGVLEAIRISCAGYPTRRTFYEFVNRFGMLAPEVLEGK